MINPESEPEPTPSTHPKPSTPKPPAPKPQVNTRSWEPLVKPDRESGKGRNKDK
jgi:hypothetical protein